MIVEAIPEHVQRLAVEPVRVRGPPAGFFHVAGDHQEPRVVGMHFAHDPALDVEGFADEQSSLRNIALTQDRSRQRGFDADVRQRWNNRSGWSRRFAKCRDPRCSLLEQSNTFKAVHIPNEQQQEIGIGTICPKG